MPDNVSQPSRRGRIHRTGCGGRLRTLYTFANEADRKKHWRSVGQVCTKCRQVKMDPLTGS